jgi:hypothetical protein
MPPFPVVQQLLWRSLAASVATLLLCSCRASGPPPGLEGRREVVASTPADPAAPGPPDGVSSTASAPAPCGAGGQVECPTQRWMKSTLQAYLRTHDYKRLEVSFNDLAAHAPRSFDRWETLAKSGARAAANHDEALVRQTCQDCHDTYRADFRRRLRSVDLL